MNTCNHQKRWLLVNLCFLAFIGSSISIAESLASPSAPTADISNKSNKSNKSDRIYQISYNRQVKTNNPLLPTIRMIYEEAGLKVNFLPQPFIRSIVNANAGVTDGEAGKIPVTAEHYENLIRVEPAIFTFTGVIYSAEGGPQNVTAETLKNYRVAIRRGSIWHDHLLDDVFTVTAENCLQMLDLILKKRVEIGLCPDRVLMNLDYNNQTKFQSLHTLQPPLLRAPFYHYIHKKNADILPLLSDAIKRLIAEGKIDPLRSWLK